MPELVEVAVRAGAATTFLILSVILLRDGRNLLAARLGALFAVMAAVRVIFVGLFCDWLMTWAPLLVLVAFGAAAAFWLFARAMFEDGFRMGKREWAVLAGVMALGGGWLVSPQLGAPPFVFRIPFQIAEILCFAGGLWVAWTGRNNDLVEPRRRTRIWFVILAGAFLAGVTLYYVAPGKAPAVLADINLAGMLAIALGLMFAMAGFRDPETLGVACGPASSGSKPSDVVACADPTEARLLARLRRTMEEDRAYRAENLTIGALAARLEAPEYLLRRLINRRLGFRNFSAFINSWRLAEAMAALADPDQAAVPISTIALDAGFSSLGPFNRAFRAETGLTPSDFRQAARSRAGLDSSPKLKTG